MPTSTGTPARAASRYSGLIKYAITRTGIGFIVLAVASFVIFVVLRLVPGDPASVLAGADATDDSTAAIRSALGLDSPLFAQYFTWIGHALTGDLGQSYIIGGSISDLVWPAFGKTVTLSLFALALALIGAITLTILALTVPRMRPLVNVVNSISVAIPPFVTGVLLTLVFAVSWRLLPAGGIPRDGLISNLDETVQYLILPGICLALPVLSAFTRFLTDALDRERSAQYALTATALGVSPLRFLVHGALRNALPTFLTILGLQAGQLLSGAILVESIFAWPGLGQLLQLGISARDYPVVQITLLISVTTIIVIQIATDIAHAVIDPRIRLASGK